MDPHRSSQDVLRCHLCETPVPPLYCDNCKLNLCKPCVGEHLSDESTEHKVVPFKKRGSTHYCTKHSTKFCELYCEQCVAPICVQCISSGEHLGHKQADIVKYLESKNENLQKDLKELEKSIYPKNQEVASYISDQKSGLRKNSKKLKTALDKQGENLHKEIDDAVKKFKTKVDEMESKEMAVLDKQEDEIKRNISEITQIIADVKILLYSDDVSRASSYKYSIAKFRKTPPKITVTLPSLSSQKINKKHIYWQFGYLSAGTVSTEKYTSTSRKIPSASRPKKTQYKEEKWMNPSSDQFIQRMPQHHYNYQNSYESNHNEIAEYDLPQSAEQQFPWQGFWYPYQYPMVRPQSPYVRYNVSGPCHGPAGTGAGYSYRNPKKTMEQFSGQYEDYYEEFGCPNCYQTYPSNDALHTHMMYCMDQDGTY